MRFPFEKQWIIPDHPPSAPDCFVIPSYALKDRFTPTKPTVAQIKLAAEWWQRFPRSSLIMCTGDNQRLGLTNASVMAAYAVRQGVPAGNVIEEDESLNTYENLDNAWKIIRERNFRQPTLVTLDLYTRRAVATPLPRPGKWAGEISIGSRFIPAVSLPTVTNGSRPIRASRCTSMKCWLWFTVSSWGGYSGPRTLVDCPLQLPVPTRSWNFKAARPSGWRLFFGLIQNSLQR